MKSLLSIAFFLITFFTFSQTDSLVLNNIPFWVRSVVHESSLMQNYELDYTRNPFYLEADFNGDGLVDIAFFIKSKMEGREGVLIVNRGKNVGFVLGAGKDIGMGSNISWCDTWFVYREKYIYNFKDKKKKYIIYNPGIELVKTENTSLIVYWDKKRYKTHVKNL